MKKHPKSRNRKEEIPLGFTIFYDLDHQARWRCPKIFQLLTGEFRRCSVPLRKKQIQEHIKTRAHRYSIPRDEDEYFPEDFQNNTKIKMLNQVHDSVKEAIALFIGKVNLSA
jgi:hypothetical protein